MKTSLHFLLSGLIFYSLFYSGKNIIVPNAESCSFYILVCIGVNNIDF